MLEVKFIAGEEIFAVVKDRIETHICMGAFEIKGVMKYVATPYWELSVLTDDNTFKTFDEAKAYLTELWENSIKVAEEQLKWIKLISESDVEEIPNATPTEEEMVADEKALAEEAIEKWAEAQEESKPETAG